MRLPNGSVQAALVLGLLAVSCGLLSSNKNPVISSIGGCSSIAAGECDVWFVCNATDPDGDPLSYTWSCTQGYFSSDSGKRACWNAPGRSGSDTIGVTVTDGRGGEDSAVRQVLVLPVTATLVDWDGAIAGRDYRGWTPQIESGSCVYGSFSVDSFDIHFMVLDGANYDKWSHGQQYTSEIEFDRSPGASFSDTVHKSGTHFVILDNCYTSIPKYAHAHVEMVSP